MTEKVNSIPEEVKTRTETEYQNIIKLAHKEIQEAYLKGFEDGCKIVAESGIDYLTKVKENGIPNVLNKHYESLNKEVTK